LSNVFVLCTGRCGSTTFAKAASHIVNYTAGHETRSSLVGAERLAYPPNHIEVDNRLSWVLGRLEAKFGKDARYVHLLRDPVQTARSFEHRWNSAQGIITAYRDGILMGSTEDKSAVCADYVETVTENIRAFLADKPHQMEFRLENAERDWEQFWGWIGAEGDFDASKSEWSTAYNPTPPRPAIKRWLSRSLQGH
jgi:hypothetical protein